MMEPSLAAAPVLESTLFQRCISVDPSPSTAERRVDISVQPVEHVPRRRRAAMGSTTSLGPYRVLEPLGQGGMGVVYRARHATSERAVAIKTVRVAAPRWIESLRREVDALTRIRHPGIVRIIEHGVHEGRPWYAMELLEGESLRDFIARVWSPFRRHTMPPKPRTMTRTAPVSELGVALEGAHQDAVLRQIVGDPPVAAGSLREVLELVRRVCATLAFLHGEGFVNCDIKPENILLVRGAPVLIDFGLSTRFPAASGREAIEAQHGMSGTLLYMSPEQLRGELVDARSDLYAVGCLLYELLTGEAPFGGAPHSIREQHLSATAVPPSRLVRDVPEQLEMLVLRLLAKSPVDRLGFADDLANALVKISGSSEPLHDFPPARPYLYRPRFVGRTEAMVALTKLCSAASRGEGSLALVGGESGVGKTRLALELMGSSEAAGLRVIASESVALSIGDVVRSVPAALHAVRPFLRSVADRCQEGGAETTERLLGHRRSVLALYEPLLNEVPAVGEPNPIAVLGPVESRQRLLRYLAQTLSAFAQERPVLWVLDDLGWADDLSLAFLQSLTSEHFSETPALIVGTYRSEEPTEAITGLLANPDVVRFALPPLNIRDVTQMVADMLALPSNAGDFSAYVANAAEGNPFFVTEHVRTAVAQSLFYRDEHHTWRTRNPAHGSPSDFGALPLPQSLRELLEQRLNDLNPYAREAAVAAAVLGRESLTDLVVEVADLSADAASAAVDELIRRHIVEPVAPSNVRFAHDKLREVAYLAPPAKLQELHGRAAVALERRLGREEPTEWATLAHHFAAAGQYERALWYFRRAGDHARSSFANADAIVLYRRALDLIENHLLGTDGTGGLQHTLRELREALGDVLALRGHRDDARQEYDRALLSVDRGDSVTIARIHRKVGKTWEVEHRHDEAMRLYRLGTAVLSGEEPPPEADAASEWLDTCLDQLWVHYWLAESEEMERLVLALTPVAEKHGTPQQLAGLCQCQIFHRLRRDRYNISADTLALGETVLSVAGGEGAPNRPWAHFQRGFLRLCSGKLDEAEADLATALQLAHRAGDVVNEARAALYFAVAARMRGDGVAVAARSAEAATLARIAGMREYVAGVLALEAWLSLRRDDLDEVLRSSDEALSIWATYGGVFPFHHLGLVPRLEAQLRKNQIGGAIDTCRGLLREDQQRLPGSIEAPLGAAVSCWEAGDSNSARAHLDVALRALDEHRLR